MAIPRIVITPGEPAGIGPDVVLMAAQDAWPAELICVADRDLLTTRARVLGIDIKLVGFTHGAEPRPHQPGQLVVVHIPTDRPVIAGNPLAENAGYVLATLAWAVNACVQNDASAMVTGPVQKSIIAESGVPFTGHTEFLAAATDTRQVVMMLAANGLRVALATTHLALREVPAAITAEGLSGTIDILHDALRHQFAIDKPRVAILGLNPHAGENGQLGMEEKSIIEPVCQAMRARGMNLLGPLPADTAFTSETRNAVDAYLAMYHDQGLPVLKFAGFHEAVNITLGLPIVRTSVDHGTALALAGTGNARSESMKSAIEHAIRLSHG